MIRYLYVCYGRFNPPHFGHLMMMDYAQHKILRSPCDRFVIVPTHTIDNKKNFLTFDEKVELIKEEFNDCEILQTERSIPFVELTHVLEHKFKPEKMIFIFGGDQIEKFQEIYNVYKKDFPETPIEFELFADRRKYPISSTMMRDYVRENNYLGFCSSAFTRKNDKLLKELYNKLHQRINSIDEERNTVKRSEGDSQKELSS